MSRMLSKMNLISVVQQLPKEDIEAINKWLDEEYGCSFTRLEELYDFYFEKYCDLKQENKQLKYNWNKLKEYIRENIIYDDVGMKILDPSPLEDYMQKLEQRSDK